MSCCTPEAPEHERFGRPPVPCIKGGFVARDEGPQLVASGLAAFQRADEKADVASHLFRGSIDRGFYR